MRVLNHNQKRFRERGNNSAGHEFLTAAGSLAGHTSSTKPLPRAVTPFDRLAARKLLQFLGNPAISVVLWDESEVDSSHQTSVVSLRFRDRGALYRTLFHPELNFGDLYSAGRVEVQGDLPGFLVAVYRGLQQNRPPAWSRTLNQLLQELSTRFVPVSSVDNIHHHYDIGNDFYRLWLDRKAMQYTCAYYPDPDMELEQAQLAKMQHICRKLQLKPGERVVEAGCGWGGLALFMARNYGARVKAYNISTEQIAYARETAQAQGLADLVEYVQDDYRNIDGHFDVFVSVGMLEHVGLRNYPAFGRLINRILAPAGRGLIHSIGRNRAKPFNPWIEKRIFPGAYPPALREIMDIFEPNELSVLDTENLRMHYVLTLDSWLRRFEQSAGQIERMTSEPFVRAWRLYLAGSKAAFETGQLQLFQLVFAREDNNSLPWSRAHQYTDLIQTRSKPRA